MAQWLAWRRLGREGWCSENSWMILSPHSHQNVFSFQSQKVEVCFEQWISCGQLSLRVGILCSASKPKWLILERKVASSIWGIFRFGSYLKECLWAKWQKMRRSQYSSRPWLVSAFCCRSQVAATVYGAGASSRPSSSAAASAGETIAEI